MPPCPRPACSATRWRTSPSSSPLRRSRLRQSGTSCPGVQLLPPPGRRRQCLGLLVAEGGPLPPPPLPRSRRSSLQPSSAVEPAAIVKVNINTWFIERCGDIVACHWKESISAQNYEVQPAGKANHTATWKPLKNLFKTHLLNCHWASSGPTTQTPNKICLTFFFILCGLLQRSWGQCLHHSC